MRVAVISFLILIMAGACRKVNNTTIFISENPSSLELLAAKEVRRYVYLRTNELLDIHKGKPIGAAIVLGIDHQLNLQEYKLKTEEHILKISGGSEEALLWGVYELAEQLGVRFYMHGDVIPDEKISFAIPVLDIREKPLFKLRGIQPFHDFPEGPDWWNKNDYKAVFAQLVKMKMNFFGLHTYPERRDFNGEGPKAEPLVWIGKEEDVLADGKVKAAYPALHFNTADSTWGYMPVPTSDFCCGASQLFEADLFGTDYMKGISGWPHSQKENIELFNNTGEFFNEVFAFGQSVGLQICVGTESAITIPEQMKKRYGMGQPTDEDIKSIYKGIFSRISRTFPIDYYWLWTPENWTWQPITDEEVANTQRDMQLAYEALDELGKPFQLATCGWVLGPPKDRAQFDRILPKEMPFSCINRGVGYSPVEAGFSKITDRPTWSIPWMEDDPDLISTQLWVGRLRKDALDSYQYGCSGLFGIHWRTRELGPNVSALAKAAWTADEWTAEMSENGRDLPAEDFYVDWVKSQFGLESKELVEIYTTLDSKGNESKEGHKGDAPLNSSAWIQGPGALMSNESIGQLTERMARYDFISRLEQIRPRIVGAGNIERFDYWLNNFRFNQAMTDVALCIKRIDQAMEVAKSAGDNNAQKAAITSKVLPLRLELISKWENMTRILLSKLTTNGEMGVLANLEMHNRKKLNLINKHDDFILELGIELPEKAKLSKNYEGPTRVIVTTSQSLLEAGTDFYIRVRVLSESHNISGSMMWRTLGEQKYKNIEMKQMTRNVFEIVVPASELIDDFEYYIEVSDGENNIGYPATYGDINQTVVLLAAGQLK